MEGPINRLSEIQQRLKNVVIENQDFESLIKFYDRPDALFYLDPPYFKAEYFYDGFLETDHQRLLSILQNLRGKFILSYNNASQVKEWYSAFNI